MSENDRRRKPSFEEYAEAITKILNLINAINQLSQYYNLNQISMQYLNQPFSPVSAQKSRKLFRSSIQQYTEPSQANSV